MIYYIIQYYIIISSITYIIKHQVSVVGLYLYWVSLRAQSGLSQKGLRFRTKQVIKVMRGKDNGGKQIGSNKYKLIKSEVTRHCTFALV